MQKLELKDKNLEPEIVQIFNEAYANFINKYGEKYGDYIKNSIENISDKVRKKELYEGALASAHHEMGVVYGKSSKLSAILKHELWHVFNESSSTEGKSYFDLPEDYRVFLDSSGIVKKEYIEKMKSYQEKFKNEPERLKYLLVDYNTFFERYDLGDSEVEKWTEWFNTRANEDDMKENYTDLENGFYMMRKSSGSYYDNYINLSQMVSCIIPEEKLLEMHLNTTHNPTNYSFQDMIKEFDSYCSFGDNEREKYGFPYLKILYNTKIIDENARNNKQLTFKAIQECIETCFEAYYGKLNTAQNIDLNKTFEEIKNLQKYMVWNVDLDKMKDLPYMKIMEDIQEKFKEKCFERQNQQPDLIQLIDRIDYKSENPYTKIRNGEEIAKKIFEAENEKTREIQIGKYNVLAGQNGIKNNMYRNARLVFGTEIFNKLFDSSGLEENNELLQLFKKIENVNENDQNTIEDVYSYMYDFYKNKINENIKTDENSDIYFKRMLEEIEIMKKLAPKEVKSGEYIQGFQGILSCFSQKIGEYQEFIKAVTEEDILKDREQGHYREGFREKMSENKIHEFDEYLIKINAYERRKLPIEAIKDVVKDVNLQEVNSGVRELKDDYRKKALIKNTDNIQTLNIQDIDLNNSFFHFTCKDNLERIENNGLEPKIGSASELKSEEQPRVYLSKGGKGIIGIKNSFIHELKKLRVCEIPEEYRKYFNVTDFTNTELINENEVYEAMEKRFKDEVYFKVDAKEGEDFIATDFLPDELANEVNSSNNIRDVKGKANHTILPEKLHLIETDSGNTAFDVVEYLYNRLLDNARKTGKEDSVKWANSDLEGMFEYIRQRDKDFER